ncbi:hypothetical protein ACMDCR_22675 [Labrys okinawensis]|uniref:hypothetical protein n=1 Tax=Labrys okinawensis TaxID=346911 RepID=UPI0039BCC5FC
MKAISALTALLVAVALAGCSAGLSVGSASYNADDRRETLCTHSYGASVNAPDTQHSGVHRQGGCESRNVQDDD